LKSLPDASGKIRSPDEASEASSGSAGPGTPSPHTP
jgi:hypothetical protein